MGKRVQSGEGSRQAVFGGRVTEDVGGGAFLQRASLGDAGENMRRASQPEPEAAGETVHRRYARN